MIQSEKFWDKNADLYSKSPVKNKVDDQKKMEVTRGYFQPHTKLFEFACGTGSTAISHAPYVDNVLAIDISSNMLAIAKEKAEKERLQKLTRDNQRMGEPETSTYSLAKVLKEKEIETNVAKSQSIESADRIGRKMDRDNFFFANENLKP